MSDKHYKVAAQANTQKGTEEKAISPGWDDHGQYQRGRLLVQTYKRARFLTEEFLIAERISVNQREEVRNFPSEYPKEG